MPSSLPRFCLMILFVGLVFFSPLSWAQEEQKKEEEWYVLLTKMNIRESSSIHGKKVGRVEKGVQFRIMKEAPDNTPLYSWYLIKTQSGISGWLCGIYKGATKYAPVAKLAPQKQVANPTTPASSKWSAPEWEKIKDKMLNLQTRLQILTDRFLPGIRDNEMPFYLLLGSLLTMALYDLFLGLGRKDNSTFYFGCLCILTAFVYATSPERSLITLFPNLDWDIAAKIKAICICLGFTIFVMFISEVYSRELSKIMLRASQGSGVLFALLTLVTNAEMYTYVIVAYEAVVVVSSIYLVYVLVRASLKRRRGAPWLLGAFFFLVMTIINDILFDRGIIYTGRFVPFGVFIFFFAQWYVVSFRSSKSRVVEEEAGAYSRFVPTEFLKNLDREDIADVKLGDSAEMTMSILFSDIRNFTALSEQMTPEENFKFINSYLTVMGPVIRTNHGFIDKFIGDAIMALFDTGADDAVRGAIGMVGRLVEYNKGRKRAGYAPVRIGVGINTGSLRLGTVGERGRMQGTVIGDTVNLASRIEGLTKTYGVSLLITDQTFRSLEDRSKYHIRKLDRVRVRGKKEQVAVWEVFDCDPPDIVNYKLDVASIFDEAVSLYLSNRYEEAQELFQDCLARNQQDKTAQFFRDRCRLCIKMGVEDDTSSGIARVMTYERLAV